jgi:hypothetical protein
MNKAGSGTAGLANEEESKWLTGRKAIGRFV